MLPRSTIFLRGCSEIALLFVDDGSTDDTPLVIERLRQRHPRQVCTLRLGANVGKAEAVRRGVQVALRRRPANSRLLGCRFGDAAGCDSAVLRRAASAAGSFGS